MARSISKGIMISLAFAAVCCLAGVTSGGQAKDPLLFPKSAYTEETKTAKTSAGEKKIAYRSYKHIPYVATPVDKDYESLNVSVPVKVDEIAVDATNAPILFAIGVGGYMSVNNASSGGMGGPPGGNSVTSGNTDLALAAGYVVVSPGCRGRDNRVTFTFADYVAHVGRMKLLPAFDDFDMKQPETILFGNKTINARHFTNFSLRQTTGDKGARIDEDFRTLVNLMNSMYFIGLNNIGCAKYWWIRHGTCDNHTSQTIITNLAISLENWKKNVNTWLYWDAGHGADEDPEDFIAWIGNITGFTKHVHAGK
jgi:hypothetical protein